MSLIEIQGPTLVADQGAKQAPIVDIGTLVDGSYALTWMGWNSGGDVYTTVYGANGQPLPGSTINNVTLPIGANEYDLQMAPLAGGELRHRMARAIGRSPRDLHDRVWP